MKPPKKEFERVQVDEWLTGEITEIQYEKDHEFAYKGNKTLVDAARIIFNLDGYKEKKYTQWMIFNYGSKSRLYKLWVSALVEGAFPNMDFDLDRLKNLKIKVMYAQNGEYQNIVMVRPNSGKIMLNQNQSDIVDIKGDEPVPF